LVTALYFKHGGAWDGAAEVINALSTSMIQLTSFIMAAFVTQLVNRWYLRRLYYIALIGNLKAFVIIANGYIAVPMNQEGNNDLEWKASNARETLGRYIMLLFEFATLKCRGHMDTNEGREWLVERGFLKENEWELMVPGARHLTILSWVATVLRKCAEVGVLNPDCLHELNHLIERARSNSSDMMDRTLYDIPYAYAHMVTLLGLDDHTTLSLFKLIIYVYVQS
jgi:hypothetical protein